MKMKNVFFVVFGVLALLLTGCGAPVETGHYTKLAEIVNESVDTQKAAVSEIVVTLKETQAANAEVIEALKETRSLPGKVVDILEKIQFVPQEKLALIETVMNKASEHLGVLQAASLEAAKVYDEKAQEDKIGALIDAGIVANAASSPINPYAGPIGGILAVIAGGYAAIQRKGKVSIGKKYKAHKQGAAAFMNSGDTTSNQADLLYEKIGKARVANGVT